MKLALDYETRSPVDLKLAGAYVYAQHRETQVLCAAFSIDEGPIGVWTPWAGEKIPKALKAALENPRCEIHAWNAQFERLITYHVVGQFLAPKARADLLRPERYHCTAAWARARGLPGKLEGALDFIGDTRGVEDKQRGNLVMRRWCIPKEGRVWPTNPEDYERLVSYCKTDVEAERRLQGFLAVAGLMAREREDYLLTEVVNDTGLPVDLVLAKEAMAYGKEETLELVALIRAHSGGAVTSASAHGRLKKFLRAKLGEAVFGKFFNHHRDGERKESTDAATRERFLASEAAKEAEPEVIELLRAVDDANKSSVAKFSRIVARASLNNRVQGAYLYAGAGQTKRFSSTGVQMHNLPRATPKDLEKCIRQVKAHALNGERVMHVLASCLRPTIMAGPGKVLVWGDWSSIEARAMPWLATGAGIPGAQSKLQLYCNGLDVYKMNAGDIYGTAYEDVTETERQVGKVAELALQFGGWTGALKQMARTYRLESVIAPEEYELIAKRWRGANEWAAQYQQALFEAFLRAAADESTQVGGVRYYPLDALRFDDRGTVACNLPDDTVLLYPGARGGRMAERRIQQHDHVQMMHWDDYDISIALLNKRRVEPEHYRVTKLNYFKAAFNRLGIEEDIWHGLLAENVTQGFCAALLRHTLFNVNAALKKFPRDSAKIVGHTHDEILLEVERSLAHKAEGVLRREMTVVPAWAEGFPLAAEIKTGLRYVK